MPIVAQHLQDQVELDDHMRLMRFERAGKAYHGEWPQPLKIKTGQPNFNTEVNFARVVIDKGVSFLFGKGVDFELDESADTDAEEWLQAAWRANKKQARLHAIGLNGGVYGHPFVKIVPAQPYPRIIVLDPATVTVDWDIEDIEKVIRYTITYPAKDPYTKKMVSVRQIVERQPGTAGDTWTVVDQRNDPDGGDEQWITVKTVDWPYSWSPILHCQNLPAPSEFWGVSDLEDDLLTLNQRANFLLSNMAKIVHFHGHPKTWGAGFDSTDMKMGVEDTLILPEGATLQNLEARGDLASTITLYLRLREALHELARVPEVATGKMENVGQLSGLALQILFGPLLEKTETKRSLYGELLVEICQRLLELGNFGPENVVTLHWPEPLPSDPLAERQALQIDAEFGVSDDTILTKLGYDPDLEREKRAAEQPPTPAPLAAQPLPPSAIGQPNMPPEAPLGG